MGKHNEMIASGGERLSPNPPWTTSTDAPVFEAYLEHPLALDPEEGQVVVMDDLPAHKPDGVVWGDRRRSQLGYHSAYGGGALHGTAAEVLPEFVDMVFRCG